jgi:hypothetical protein
LKLSFEKKVGIGKYERTIVAKFIDMQILKKNFQNWKLDINI